MGALDSGLDTLFASELAIDAVYTPSPGSPVTVRTMLRAPDVDTDLLHGTKLQQQSTIFDIRKSELAAPSKTATLTVGTTVYRVTTFSTKDPRRAVWSLEAVIQ